jgi:hypothetical protein
MYSVGMRIPTRPGAFVGGSQLFGQPVATEAPADKLRFKNNLPVLVRVHAVGVNALELVPALVLVLRPRLRIEEG